MALLLSFYNSCRNGNAIARCFGKGCTPMRHSMLAFCKNGNAECQQRCYSPCPEERSKEGRVTTRASVQSDRQYYPHPGTLLPHPGYTAAGGGVASSYSADTLQHWVWAVLQEVLGSVLQTQPGQRRKGQSRLPFPV